MCILRNLLSWILKFSQWISVKTKCLLWLSTYIIKWHLQYVLVSAQTEIKIHINIKIDCLRLIFKFKLYFIYSLISAGWDSSSSPERIIPFSFTLPVNLTKQSRRPEIKRRGKKKKKGGRQSTQIGHKLYEYSTYMSKSWITVSRDIEQELLISVALHKLEIKQNYNG